MELTDLHCHIVPYVDDGAEDFEEAIELLKMLSAQGVKQICATPHLRARMFETPDSEIKQRFAELKEMAAEQQIPIGLALSREYHCDSNFFKLLAADQFIPMGRSRTILCEFSGSHEEEFVLNTVMKVKAKGYQPLIAHAERIAAVHKNRDMLRQARAHGALIQINAASIAGEEGFSLKNFTRKLAKENLIDVVASDAHDPVNRPPYLEEAARWLTDKTGAAYAKRIMYTIPTLILYGEEALQ